MKKIPYQEAKTVLSYFELSEEASELIEETMSPREVVEALNKGSLYIDLASFFFSCPTYERVYLVGD
ncbi:hypothetical protein JCM19233_6264 [Vibrio astriarenae]|nr:hypothetical protein JCM19233_6264 [Vibrio sp. C7]